MREAADDSDWATPRLKWPVIAVLAAITALLLFLGAYFASPYFALDALRKAAAHAEQDHLAQEIDFPAVRASFKAQLANGLMARLKADPQPQDGPLAQFGALLLPRLADRVVDAFVTPAFIAALADGANPPLKAKRTSVPGPAGPAAAPATRARPVYEQTYVSLKLFRVSVRAQPDADPVVFSFQRSGLFGWKLFDILLPPSALQSLPSLDLGIS